jgi:hypothetical protein
MLQSSLSGSPGSHTPVRVDCLFCATQLHSFRQKTTKRSLQQPTADSGGCVNNGGRMIPQRAVISNFEIPCSRGAFRWSEGRLPWAWDSGKRAKRTRPISTNTPQTNLEGMNARRGGPRPKSSGMRMAVCVLSRDCRANQEASRCCFGGVYKT